MFDDLPYNKEKTWPILEQCGLSIQAWELIQLSFRTRIKRTEEGVVSVQFRILPEKITAQQEAHIPAVREEIIQKLTACFPQEPIAVTMHVTLCCGSDCFGCRQFGR